MSSILKYASKTKQLLLGKARDLHDPHIFHKLSLVAFFAWVGLGADGLSSSCYGPEEAFLALKGIFFWEFLLRQQPLQQSSLFLQAIHK